jgi:hypothetical protein
MTMVVDTFPKFFENSAKYLTYWGLWATLIYLFWASFMFSLETVSIGFFATFNHTVVALNVLITIFWFSFVFSEEITHNLDFYLGILRHSIPLIFSFVEFLINNNVIFYKNMPYLLIFFFVYTPINYIFSAYGEKPVYAPINYKDYMSAMYILLSAVLCLGSSALVVLAQSVLKPWIFVPMQEEYEKKVKYENENDKICEVEFVETKDDKGSSKKLDSKDVKFDIESQANLIDKEQ